MTFPPGVAHTFDNTKKDQPRVKVINIMTPGGYDQAILAFNQMGSHIARLDQIQAIGAQFGVTFIGPTLREKLGLG